MTATESLPTEWRFVVIDASSMPAPGATGTDHRLHIAMDLVSLQCIEVLVSDVHTGATLKHCPLAPGDVVVADRGDAQGQGMRTALQQGAALIVRCHPCSVVLRDAAGEPLELSTVLKRQTMAPLRTLPVVLHAAGGQQEGRGSVPAYRLNAEQANRARQKCRQGHKQGTPQAASLLLAGWVLVLTTRSPVVLSAQTIMALSRCRWQVAIAMKRWKRVLDVDALRAQATSPLAEGWLHGTWLYALLLERRMRRQRGDTWSRWDHERLATWWRVWGRLKDAIAPMLTGALVWQDDAWVACLQVVAARPRRRQ
jgi:Transposase DDE domain